MNVSYLTTSFPRFPGDYAGVFVYDLARTLAKQQIEITVLAPHEPGSPYREQMAGLSVKRFAYFFPARYQKIAYGAGIPTNLRNNRWIWLQLPLFLVSFFLHAGYVTRKHKIIHAHWIEPGLFGLIWRTIFRQPLIVSVHRFNPMGTLGKRLYRLVLKNADFVLFNSHYTEARCREQIQVRAGAVIPPGIDTERFYSKWEASEGTKNEDADELPMIFGLGSLLPVKGFINLIEAMPFILSEYACRVVIGGRGPEREALLARAQALGVDHALTLLGRVPTEDVPDLMRKAAVFVLPSVAHASGDTEALGMVLVEAMSCGTVCVASNVGGVGDIVDDGENGYLVPHAQPRLLADKVVQLLKDPALRWQMGQQGRRKVEEQFSLDVVAERVRIIYEQVCGQAD